MVRWAMSSTRCSSLEQRRTFGESVDMERIAASVEFDIRAVMRQRSVSNSYPVTGHESGITVTH
jgi:hypothetical protein